MHLLHQVKTLGYISRARKLRGENTGSGWLSITETKPVVVVAVVRVVVIAIGDPAVVGIVVPVATAQQSPWRFDLREVPFSTSSSHLKTLCPRIRCLSVSWYGLRLGIQYAR